MKRETEDFVRDIQESINGTQITQILADMVNQCASVLSAQFVFHYAPSAFIRIHLLLISSRKRQEALAL